MGGGVVSDLKFSSTVDIIIKIYVIIHGERSYKQNVNKFNFS